MPYIVSLHQQNYVFMQIMNSGSTLGGINLGINSVCKVSVFIMGHLRLIEYYCTQKAHKLLTFGPKTHQLVYYGQLKI